MVDFEAFKRCVRRNKITSDIPELAIPQGSFLVVQRQHLGVAAMFETTLMKEEILSGCRLCKILIYSRAFTFLVLLYGMFEPSCLGQQPTWQAEQLIFIHKFDSCFPSDALSG